MKLEGQTRRVLFLNPDQQLVARIKCTFRRSGYAPLNQVQVVVEGGEVFLGGCVPTYFLKQVAQTEVLALSDVRRVNNDLVVGRQ